ncbi:MAG: hypothetical protein K9H26_01255 [Prolixibacteraceae bacterium]|nr:hypothetical protein [Prolixibacteraceae bacterium]
MLKPLYFFLVLLMPLTLFSQWEELTDVRLSEVPSKTVTSEYVDSLSALILWDSILISTDYGTTWNLLNSDDNGYTDLRFLPNGIAFSKWDTLYITRDLGNSYEKIKLPEFVVTEFSLLDDFIVVSTPFYSLMSSNDRGKTWQTITKYTDENYDRECWQSGSPHCTSIHTSGDFMGIDGNNVFYNLNRVEYREGTAVSTIDKGLHKSWNNGQNWVALDIKDVNDIRFA